MTDVKRLILLFRLAGKGGLVFILATIIMSTRHFFFTWFESAWYATLLEKLMTRELSDVLNTALIFLGILAIYLVIDILGMSVQRVSLEQILNTLRMRVIKSYLQASAPTQEQIGHYSEVVSRINTDVEIAGQAYSATLIPLMFLFSGIGGFITTALIHPAIPAISIAIGLLMLVTQIKLGQYERLVGSKIRVHDTNLLKRLYEGLEYQITIRTQHLFPQLLVLFKEEQDERDSKHKNLTKFSAMYGGVGTFLDRLHWIVILLFIVYLLSRSMISLSDGVLALGICGLIPNMLTAIGLAYKNMQQALIGADRIYDIVEIETENDMWKNRLVEKGYTNLLNKNHDIVLSADALTFSYPNGDHKIFDNWSFDAVRNAVALLPGDNGRGKTTFIKIVLGFYPYEGDVKFDGKAISDWMAVPAEYRNQLAYLPQSNYILDGTVRFNLLFDDTPSVNRENEMHELCQKLNMDEVLSALPNGYTTFINSDFAGLSSGQRQMIGIIRVLLAPNAKILLLDEPFSSLSDTQTERVIVALDTYLKAGRGSILLVDHRQLYQLR